jgi:hypothetical protein
MIIKISSKVSNKRQMKKILLSVFLLAAVSSLYAQLEAIDTQINGVININWTEPIEIENFDESKIISPHFVDAIYAYRKHSLPTFEKVVYLNSSSNTAETIIRIESTSPLSLLEAQAINLDQVETELNIQTTVTWYRKKPIAAFSFLPIYKDPSSGEVLKITSFSYEIIQSANRNTRATQSNYKVNSVLRYGNWAKIGTTADGIYQLTFSDLQSLGMPTTDLSSNSIRVFGNGGGYLPFNNSEPRIDDLEENNIEVFDGGDGVFNTGDYILFYGQSPHRWKPNGNRFNHYTHIFSDTTYYFVTTDYNIGTPKRIQKKAVITAPADITVSEFNDFQYHELDLENFVKSGRVWYGESFNYTKDQSFGFSFPNAIKNTANIKSRLAFRVIQRSSTFTMAVGGNTIQTLSHPGVSGGYYAEYAGVKAGIDNFTLPSDNFEVEVNFSNPSSSDNGWIDYLEINCERQLTFTGNQMTYRNLESQNASIIQYNLSGNNFRVWNVTEPTNVIENTLSNNTLKERGGQLNEFIAFNTSSYLQPTKFGKVANQDLHAIQTADYIIITHPNYINQANQLANYHRQFSKLNTYVVTTQQVYNEFSSGSQDITAIKTFNKMLYDRAGSDPDKMLKYVLLLGDASYDYKYRKSNNTNQVPSYQSNNSRHPLESYVSDDYFGFLDDNESDALNSSLDIGIGRIMANNVTQAQDIVDKTINYMSSSQGLRPWRNNLTFVGDDQDGNLHMAQSDQLATKMDTDYFDYNVNKIYLDAYQQISNAGGSTYPDVNTAIDQATDNGSLIINYAGHGGELGWAHERVLGVSQIKGYSNKEALALYVTATCEFSRYDDPDRTSAGEFALLNPAGGALALLTTSRLVFANENFVLTKRFFSVVFEQVGGQRPRLGDLLRISKIAGSSINTRNFTLLGDPAAMLAYPEYKAQTQTAPDTLKSLQEITITGIVTDAFSQKIPNFNGVIYPTIYGQKKMNSTLNNDNNGVMQFETQQNALFNGKASVTNGEFQFSFIVPKDINFKYDKGKVSYYSENGVLDASGSDSTIIIGGQDGDPTADQVGPTVNLWMNDESFIVGGLTDESPKIFAKIYDESGINTVGNGIGHDIVATIDENTSNAITLNEYYESELDSYKNGSLSYQLSNLSEGKHTLRLKVWDVYNNSSEAFTEFVVSKSSGFDIEHVLNYPNPFTTNTDFYFDHNALGQQLTIRVQIFTVSGKLVKTIDHSEISEGYRAGPINWDGRDQYGDRIGKGTYIYKIKVTNSFDQSVEKFEKIVIL